MHRIVKRLRCTSLHPPPASTVKNTFYRPTCLTYSSAAAATLQIDDDRSTTEIHSYSTPAALKADPLATPNQAVNQVNLLKLRPLHAQEDEHDYSNPLATIKAFSPSQCEESMAVIGAMLESGRELARAEVIFNQMWRRNPATMALYTTTDVINSFIDAACRSGAVDLALDWLNRFEELRELVAKYGGVDRRHRVMIASNHDSDNAMDEIVADVHEEVDVLAPNNKTYNHFILAYHKKKDTKGLKAIIERMLGEGLDLEASFHMIYRENEELGEDLLVSLNKLKYYVERPRDDVEVEETPSPDTEFSLLDSTFKKAYPTVSTPTLDSLQRTLRVLGSGETLYQQQQKIEEECYDTARRELEELQKDGHAIPPTIEKGIIAGWHAELTPLVQKIIEDYHNMEELKKKKSGINRGYLNELDICGPFMTLPGLSPEKISLITITEMLKAHVKRDNDDNTVRAMGLFRSVGSALEQEYTLTIRRGSKSYAQYDKTAWAMGSQGLMSREQRIELQRAGKAAGVLSEDGKYHRLIAGKWRPRWGDAIRVKIGSMLVHRLMGVARLKVGQSWDPDTATYVEETKPAFLHDYIPLDGKCIGVIHYTEELLTRLSKRGFDQMLDPRLLPMIVRPKAWTSWRSGGYLSSKIDCIRIRGNIEHQDYIRAADSRGLLTTVYEALDVLGATEWKINKQVFKVVEQVWSRKLALGGLPGNEPSEPVLEEGDDAKRKWKKKKDYKEDKAKWYSQMCEINYKLHIAKAFLTRTMYFPHNLDFRGRAYPIPVHLNHIGDDLCRGLLLFGRARPLGVSGLRWLKIQLANVFGMDKASFEERLQFVEDHVDDIMDSADRPLEGRQWWAKAEDPWQCLAACIDLTNALRSPDPTLYESRLPVHQDGTCNGLQHYAALGGDMEGARHVNLVPSERPQDVYTGVAKQVEAKCIEDAKNGVAEAIIMQDKITRKLVKQTVMTYTYGVTFMGGRDQVLNRMKEWREEKMRETGKSRDEILNDDDMVKCAIYVVQKIFEALGSIFEGARRIQTWLNSSALQISRSIPKEQITRDEAMVMQYMIEKGFIHQVEEEDADLTSKIVTHQDEGFGQSADEEGIELDKELIDQALTENKDLKKDRFQKMTSVIWTTPLNLTVVQPYRNLNVRSVKTEVQTVIILDYHRVGPVNARKQSTAFPPNFIHSLDASHMMLSAITCYKSNITFASVHDSYWTHAADVDRMNDILRDSFVKLHEMDIMSRLRAEFVERYAKDYRLPAIVTLSGDDLREFEEWCIKNNVTPRTGAKGLPTNFAEEHTDADGTKSIKKRRSSKRKIHTWTNLEFAPRPPRGDFDVSLVRNSSYFFH